MPKLGVALASLLVAIFGAFSSSPNYQLKSYSVGPGATNSAAGNTYRLQGSLGEQTNSVTTGNTDSANNGSIQTEQLNVPGAVTLSNNGGTYYNQLNCIVNTSSDPSDTTYAIAISSDNFTTTNYVQASGAIGSSPVYQSYSAWGGSGGFLINGLLSSTTYYVKVAAKDGLFTNTEYGAVASLATGAPTLAFSVSPNSYGFGTILTNTITTSSNLSFTFSTNATSGGGIYVTSAHGGFSSPSLGSLLSATSGDLGSLSKGFGIQGTGPSSPLTVLSPYIATTAHTVGAATTSYNEMFSTPSPITSGTATANVQVKTDLTVPPATDYGEIFTFIASASF